MCMAANTRIDVEKINPAITTFLDECIPVLRDTQGRTLVSRAYLVCLFLDAYGQGDMKLQNIKRQITIVMNYHFDKWTSVRKGVKGGVWFTHPKDPSGTHGPRPRPAVCTSCS
jgi:hypothetical protein